jgi:hypothetical protein
VGVIHSKELDIPLFDLEKQLIRTMRSSKIFFNKVRTMINISILGTN